MQIWQKHKTHKTPLRTSAAPRCETRNAHSIAGVAVALAVPPCAPPSAATTTNNKLCAVCVLCGSRARALVCVDVRVFSPQSPLLVLPPVASLSLCPRRALPAFWVQVARGALFRPARYKKGMKDTLSWRTPTRYNTKTTTNLFLCTPPPSHTHSQSLIRPLPLPLPRLLPAGERGPRGAACFAVLPLLPPLAVFCRQARALEWAPSLFSKTRRCSGIIIIITMAVCLCHQIKTSWPAGQSAAAAGVW